METLRQVNWSSRSFKEYGKAGQRHTYVMCRYGTKKVKREPDNVEREIELEQCRASLGSSAVRDVESYGGGMSVPQNRAIYRTAEHSPSEISLDNGVF